MFSVLTLGVGVRIVLLGTQLGSENQNKRISSMVFFVCLFVCLFVCFLMRPRPMEVPRLGGELEL